MAEEVTLTNQEAFDLIHSIYEVLASIENGEPLRDSWTYEMRTWCELLFARMEGEEE